MLSNELNISKFVANDLIDPTPTDRQKLSTTMTFFNDLRLLPQGLVMTRSRYHITNKYPIADNYFGFAMMY